MKPETLTDLKLHSNLLSLVQTERELLTQIIHHLNEVEKRRLFSDHQCSSLFTYCTKYLGYSEGQAHRRITAMRMIQKIPHIEEQLSEGILSLSNVAQAQKFFNQESKQRKQEFSTPEKKKILKSLENKSTREAEKKLLALCTSLKVPKERKRVVSEKHTELRIIADEELMRKLERIKGLIAHKNPNPSYAELLEVCCHIALKSLEPKEPSPRDLKKVESLVASKVTTQTTAPQTSQRRALPLAVKRVVWKRDKGQCVQCGSRYGLEYDHLHPVCLGGGNSPDNISLKCKPCNQRAAIKKIGLHKMGPYLQR